MYSESEVERRIKTAMQIFTESRKEDLTPSTWGMFSSDDWVAGAGMFTWFENSASLFDCLAEYLPFFHPDYADYGSPDYKLNNEESSAIELYTEKIRILQTDFCSNKIEKESILDYINGSEFFPASVLQWFGQVSHLATGTDEFSLTVRSHFSGWNDSDDEFVEGVPSDLLEEFYKYLKEYIWG